MLRNTRVLAIVAAAMLALVLPGTTLAAKPIAQFHDHFTDSFSDNVCGIDVDVALVVTDNFYLFADDSFKDTSSVRQTWTNPANGKAVTISSAGVLVGTAVIDEDAGTITSVADARSSLTPAYSRTNAFACSVSSGSTANRLVVMNAMTSASRLRAISARYGTGVNVATTPGRTHKLKNSAIAT